MSHYYTSRTSPEREMSMKLKSAIKWLEEDGISFNLAESKEILKLYREMEHRTEKAISLIKGEDSGVTSQRNNIAWKMVDVLKGE